MGQEGRQNTAHPSGAAGADVKYQYNSSLPHLLTKLDLSIAISTYQVGKVITIGTFQERLQVGFTHFHKAMGVARTPQGLAVVDHDGVWRCAASREIAPRLTESGEHDCAFFARGYHRTGPVMGHELAWGEKPWLVNTAFNCLATLEEPWNFVPRWQPPFIQELSAGDRCHLNGFTLGENEPTPQWATVLGETDVVGGWRSNKLAGGALFHVPSNTVARRGLCMPHSPRIYRGEVYLLESGGGALLQLNPASGEVHTLIKLPGFTRGLDLFEGHAFIGLSKIRESAVFGGLPVAEQNDSLVAGLSIVNLASRKEVGRFWFTTIVDEIFSTVVLPGFRNPVIIGPHASESEHKETWLVPAHHPP